MIEKIRHKAVVWWRSSAHNQSINQSGITRRGTRPKEGEGRERGMEEEEGRVRQLRKTSGLGSPAVLFLRSGKFVHRGDRARSERRYISRSFVAARVVLDSHRVARRRSLLPHCWSLGFFLCSPSRSRVRMCVPCPLDRICVYVCCARARSRMGASSCSTDARARICIYRVSREKISAW